MASLNPQQAKKLARVQLAYVAAKRAADRAKQARDEVLEEYRDRLPAGEWLQLAGYRIRRAVKSTGSRFSLRAYQDAGNKVTAAMSKFITRSEYEELTVEPLE